MISSISGNIKSIAYTNTQNPVAKQPPQLTADSAATLPANESESVVNISQKALELFAAKAISSSPVLVAALSNNAQIDELATTIYSAQRNRELIDTYANNTDDANDSTESQRSPLAISAISQNPQVDELATTVYSAKQAQQLLDIYQSNTTNITEQQSTSLNETA